MDRDTVSVAGQITKKMKFQPTITGSYYSRSFDSGKDFIPYLSWIIKFFWYNNLQYLREFLPRNAVPVWYML